MGRITEVMLRIEALYQQYADGLILDTECLSLIRAVCDSENERILATLRESAVVRENLNLMDSNSQLLKTIRVLEKQVHALEREVEEQDALFAEELLEVGLVRVNDTIPAPQHPAFGPTLDVPIHNIPSVTVGDEVSAGVIMAMAGGDSLNRFGSNEP